MIDMQDRTRKEWSEESKSVKRESRTLSRLVIEENTIYEIDLECQCRKKCNKDASCEWCNEKKGV